MERTTRVTIALLIFVAASAFLLADSYADVVRNRTSIRDFMAISTMAPIGFFYLMIAGVVMIANDLVLGLLVGLLAYFATSYFKEGPVNAYWVVREDPIRCNEWSECQERLPKDASKYGTCFEQVPTDLPEPHHPQPGIRFFPANREALGGYVQIR
jgi:hypothetical protein